MALHTAVSTQIGAAQLPRLPTCSLYADKPTAASSVQFKKCVGLSGQSLQQQNSSALCKQFLENKQAQWPSRFLVRASVKTVEVTIGQVTEVDKDSFWPAVDAAGDKVVVLDMYTQWCGPCKIIAPKLQELSEKYSDVVFLKLDCNQENKPLAKELGVKVVPTFKVLKGKNIVKEVSGAKLNDLIQAIETVKSSP
uniref:Thioredoxin domain-containing protein n=1 Tax=Picea sitchensis TaxID=3332 RepID=A9NPJ8_PICSI|nr:unknown [Picea sitchensis]ACN40127.1 unknown [Picea sitchensis]